MNETDARRRLTTWAVFATLAIAAVFAVLWEGEATRTAEASLGSHAAVCHEDWVVTGTAKVAADTAVRWLQETKQLAASVEAQVQRPHSLKEEAGSRAIKCGATLTLRTIGSAMISEGPITFLVNESGSDGAAIFIPKGEIARLLDGAV